MAQSNTVTAQPGKYSASMRTRTIYGVSMALGLIGLLAAFYLDSSRAWHSYLTSYFVFTSLALGGLFFAAIHHVSKAGWSVSIRRFAEAMTAFLPIAAVGAVVLLLGSKSLYIWLDPQIVAQDALIRGKAAYLNMPFFIIRLVVFFGGWLLFTRFIVGHSLKQDEDGSVHHTLKNVGISIGFLLFFALSYSFFSVDTLMSLSPHWYSTMWGVYCFSGLIQSTFAFLCILTVAIMKRGLVRGLVSEDHLHDLGKYLMGFTIFYAYIGFSQFLLIWYANLPEETIFYLSRSSGGWMVASFSLLIFKFVIPFLLLLPKAAKRAPAHLVLVSVLVLIMQYVDIHWIVYPNLVGGNIEKYGGNWIFGWQEASGILLFGGLFLWSVTNFLSRHSIVPMKDPRLVEAANHHVTY